MEHRRERRREPETKADNGSCSLITIAISPPISLSFLGRQH